MLCVELLTTYNVKLITPLGYEHWNNLQLQIRLIAASPAQSFAQNPHRAFRFYPAARGF